MENIFNNIFIFLFTDGKAEVAALSAGALWAIASVIYGVLGERIPPMQLNLMKAIIAIALLLVTILLSGEFLPKLEALPVFLLCCSGVVGIGFGDTAFLAAINYLGARRVLLIGTLAPPMTAIAGMFFLQESLKINAWCGILLTIIGVAWVVTERVADVSDMATTHLWRGIGFALLAAITNTIGTLLSRAAFAYGSIDSLWAALLRLTAAMFIILIWLRLPQRKESVSFSAYWLSPRVIFASFFAAFCGTYLGIWLQQTAIKFTSAGIAATLMQTSPLFVIPIRICMGEKVTIRAIAGVIIAIAGITLLFT